MKDFLGEKKGGFFCVWRFSKIDDLLYWFRSDWQIEILDRHEAANDCVNFISFSDVLLCWNQTQQNNIDMQREREREREWRKNVDERFALMRIKQIGLSLINANENRLFEIEKWGINASERTNESETYLSFPNQRLSSDLISKYFSRGKSIIDKQEKKESFVMRSNDVKGTLICESSFGKEKNSRTMNNQWNSRDWVGEKWLSRINFDQFFSDDDQISARNLSLSLFRFAHSSSYLSDEIPECVFFSRSRRDRIHIRKTTSIRRVKDGFISDTRRILCSMVDLFSIVFHYGYSGS